MIKDRELVDGGIVSTTNVDIAVEAGAKFIVVVNPLVPFVNDFSKQIPTMLRHAACAASRTWASRRSATRRSSCSPTSACTRWRASWEERYPGVDIILIEPEPDDELMFETSILNYSLAGRDRAHGFESVTREARQGLRLAARDRRAARHRDLGTARAQGHPALRPRSSARRPAPGAASSSRRPARCCGSPPVD